MFATVSVGATESSFSVWVDEVVVLPVVSVAVQTTVWLPCAVVLTSPAFVVAVDAGAPSVVATLSSLHVSVEMPLASVAVTRTFAGEVLNQPFVPFGVCANENAGGLVSSFRCCAGVIVAFPAESVPVQ